MSRWFAHALLIWMSAATFAQTGVGLTKGDHYSASKPWPDIAALINSRIPEVSIGDSAFEQVIAWLQDYTGANIVVHWQMLADAGVPRDKPISLYAKNLRLSQVLWLVMNEAGGADVKLAYRASGNLIVLSTEEDLGREMLVRVYDVADLLSRFPQFQDGPRVDAQNATQGAGVFNSAGGNMEDAADQTSTNNPPNQPDPDMLRLSDLIQRTIQPDSWAANFGPGSISIWRTQLVVRNSMRVHQEIGGPLSGVD